MKTLKKTLCLVLAMVMVFGLCVTSASAKLEYTDNDDITYKEAVDVMSGIGILAGDARGFRPTDTITRAEAAKIIAYIMVGDSTQADALKTTGDPFADVPASHWASGYIAYCASAGIIAGMGDGYHPNDNVTGLQFAKMLLCALGYGVNDEYVGADWAINVSRDALRLGVFDSNLAGANNNAATREECALYAFNVIHGTDSYNGIQKVTYSALVGNYVTDNAFAGGGVVDPNKHTIFGNDFDLHRTETDADAFQRPGGHHWYVGKTTNIITADYGSAKDVYGDIEDLQASYTTGVTGADLYNLLGKTFIDGAAGKDPTNVTPDVHLYINGVEQGTTSGSPAVFTSSLASPSSGNTKLFALDNFTKDNTDVLNGTGNGVQTNVYAWSYKGGAGTVNCLTITIVDTYLAKVVDVKAGTATKDPVTTIEYFTNYTSGDATTDFTDVNAAGTKYNTDEFEEGDYVLVNVTSPNTGSAKIRNMVPAVTTEGTISRYTKTKNEVSVISGGTTYIAAKNAAEYTPDDLKAADDDRDGAVNKAIVNGKDHVLYVDEYGYLLAVGEVAAESKYVYVAKFGWKANTGDELTDKNVLTAAVYYADGTNAVVTVNNKEGVLEPHKDVGIDATGVGTINIALKNNIYKLTMKNGKAILTETASVGDNTKVTKGVATVNATNTIKADSKTAFFYVKDGAHYGEDDYDFAVEAYIGINSVPVASKDSNTTPCIKYIASTKALAVLIDDTREGEATDTVYLYTGEYYADEDSWTVAYDVYVNGQPDVLTISYKDEDAKDDAVDAAENFKNKFFTVDAKNNFTQAKLTGAGVDSETYVATGGNAQLKAIDKFLYTVDADTIHSVNEKEASLTFTTDDKSAGSTPTAITNEFAYGYSMKGVIDLVHDEDDADYIGTARTLEKLMAIGANADKIKVVVQFADNASHAIEYIYIVRLETGFTALT